MANVLSHKERAAELRLIAGIVNDMIKWNTAVESYRDKMFDPSVEQGFANLSTDVTAMLADLDTMRDRAVTQLNAVSLIYEELIIPYTTGYTGCAIDVQDAGASNRGKLTAAGGAPFTNYLAGDTIELSNCEDSDTDGEYVVHTVDSTTVLHVTTALGGADNATDTTLRIRITKR